MKFVIEKGIPIPGKHPNEGLARALRAMEVGDSVAVDLDTKSVSANVYYVAKATNRRFVTRKESDYRRIWRIQ